jgi:hypothetical protein
MLLHFNTMNYLLFTSATLGEEVCKNKHSIMMDKCIVLKANTMLSAQYNYLSLEYFPLSNDWTSSSN